MAAGGSSSDSSDTEDSEAVIMAAAGAGAGDTSSSDTSANQSSGEVKQLSRGSATDSEDEVEDPRVYANKVRKILGEHLNLPCSQMSYKDAKLCQQAAKEEGKLEAENREAKTASKYASNSSIDFVGNLTFGI